MQSGVTQFTTILDLIKAHNLHFFHPLFLIARGVRLQAKASKFEVPLSPVAYLMYARLSFIIICRQYN
jgi:hypothetical protein